MSASADGVTCTAQAAEPPGSAPDSLLPAETQQQLIARCGQMMQGSISCLCVYLGHELGLYKAMKGFKDPCTAAELAAASGLSERWVQEWLYQQASSRLVCCDHEAFRFWLSPAQADVLVEADSLKEAKESPVEMMLKMPVVNGNHEKLLQCFKTGIGLTFDATGIDHCQMHRHARAVQLEQRLRSLPGLVESLEKGVKVADVGCGSGEVLLHLAAVFPASTFVGYDISRRALSTANQRKTERGLTNVTFLNPEDGASHCLPSEPTFHLVVVMDAIHDMTKPLDMLQAIRHSLLSDTTGSSPSSNATAAAAANQVEDDSAGSGSPNQHKQQQQGLPDALADYSGGPVFVVTDIRSTGDAARNIATMPGAPFLYGVSIGICMSSALSAEGGAGLGTVGWHEDMAHKMAADAGFSSFSKLAWDADNGMNWHSHYLMRP